MATYTVIGNHRVAGVEPGGTIEIEDDAHAAYLATAGHIEPTPEPTNKKPAKAVDEEGDG